LNAHAAGDFAHRREQWQAALVIGERFVGDTRRAAGEQAIGEFFVGREVEIGEDDLTLADFFDLFLLRLLYLHDHVCPGEDIVGAFDQFGAGVLIFAIRQAGSGAGTRFDEHLVAAAR
jgi:hypothetical protein